MIDPVILYFVPGAAIGIVIGIFIGVIMVIWYLEYRHGIKIMYWKDLGVKVIEKGE
jgi:Na+-driven multidrug efflux pump